MDSRIGRVTELLNHSPAGSLPLSRLVQLLEGQGGSSREEPQELLSRLVTTQESFRVIPDRLGPWLDWPGARNPDRWSANPTPWGEDPWILPRRPIPSPPAPDDGIEGLLRECLQAWGWGMDDGSTQAVGRWISANREAERWWGNLSVRTEADA